MTTRFSSGIRAGGPDDIYKGQSPYKYWKTTLLWKAEIWLPVLWKVVFAAFAIADITSCWPVVVEGWSKRIQDADIEGPGDGMDSIKRNASDHENTSSTYYWSFGTMWDLRDFIGSYLFSAREDITDDQRDLVCVETGHIIGAGQSMEGSMDCYQSESSTRTYSSSGLFFHHPFFCISIFFSFLCLVEACVRAKEARTMAIEMAALDVFEKKLSRAVSSTRMSFWRIGGFDDTSVNAGEEQQKVMAELFARRTLRTWIPVASVLTFWIVLLPFGCDWEQYERCGQDTSLATWWITSSIARSTMWLATVRNHVSTIAWSWALPFKAHQQPLKFYKRVRQLLRWMRYVRFAGPLLRMSVKLNDQVWTLSKTWRQTLVAQAEKAKRVAHPSMLFNDIRRIESLAKVQTNLAALPSQLFHLAQDELAEIGNRLYERQKEGRRIQQQLQRLKRDYRQRIGISAGDLYDRTVELSQCLKASVTNNSILNSHNLISPHSRFGLVWRITVTNCLLLELFRLVVSWRLTGTFRVSLTQIIARLFIYCDQPSLMKERLKFATQGAEATRKFIERIVPFLPKSPEPVTICTPSSVWAKLFLHFGGALESFIDIVSFLDIFIWFFTGELDDKGVVVPKPFITRCILPGTLVQVLDHPTLPNILPSLIARAMDVADAVGWSRVFRWGLAIAPAVKILVVEPMNSYMFRHVDTTQGMMKYAESCGVLAPKRMQTATSTNFSSFSARSLNEHIPIPETDPSEVGMTLSPTLSKKTVQVDPSIFQPDESYNFSYETCQY